jgi:hypothetical protein
LAIVLIAQKNALRKLAKGHQGDETLVRMIANALGQVLRAARQS